MTAPAVDAEALEVPASVPPPWWDWINRWPTMKSLAILCLLFWVLTPAAMLVSTFKLTLETGQLHAMDSWLDNLKWLTGFAVIGVVGKFASTKPDVIRAQGEVAAKVVVAQAAAAVVTAELPVPPAAPTAPKAPEAAPAFSTAVAAMRASNTALTADPHKPVGELVDGEGD